MGNGVAVNAPGVLTGLGPGVQVDVMTLLYPFSAGSEEGLLNVARKDQYMIKLVCWTAVQCEDSGGHDNGL